MEHSGGQITGGRVLIDLESLTTGSGPALLRTLPEYEDAALKLAGRGRDVVLTGAAPIWLYLRLAHRLHGVARRLVYWSGQGEEVVVFDHASS